MNKTLLTAAWAVACPLCTWPQVCSAPATPSSDAPRRDMRAASASRPLHRSGRRRPTLGIIRRAALSSLVLAPCAIAQAQGTPPTQLQPVVVTGKSSAEQVKKELQAEQAATPGGVTLVDGEGLRQRNVTSLADMLRFVPGLWAAGGSTGD